ncbi:MAG: GGDEF domain-containing protein [bacterium]|nr:GGDEF domain-containing protein [bacterium]
MDTPQHDPPDLQTTVGLDESAIGRIRAVVGADQVASLIVLAGWEIGREFQLTEPELILGRSPDLPLPVASRSVSRRHAKIVCLEADGARSFEIADLGSTNGTQVNYTMVGSTPLRNGDKILLGEVLFKFVIQDMADARFHKEVHRRIHYDQLTGLLTLETFMLHFKAELERIGQVQEEGGPAELPVTVVMTDLDGLKRVNDTYGHLAGRDIIRQMGVSMREVLRPHDRAGLYGGDEAVLLFPDTTIEQAMPIVEQLRESIAAQEFKHGEESFSVTISQGVAQRPIHGETVEQLIAAADGALYAAKAAGRNRVSVAEG